MEKVNLAYAGTVFVYDRGKVIIHRHGTIDHVPYDDRQGRPDICEFHACARTVNKSQAKKGWRPEDDRSPPPTYMN